MRRRGRGARVIFYFRSYIRSFCVAKCRGRDSGGRIPSVSPRAVCFRVPPVRSVHVASRPRSGYGFTTVRPLPDCRVRKLRDCRGCCRCSVDMHKSNPDGRSRLPWGVGRGPWAGRGTSTTLGGACPFAPPSLAPEFTAPHSRPSSEYMLCARRSSECRGTRPSKRCNALTANAKSFCSSSSPRMETTMATQK
jgi:hypothetical protein